MHKLKAITPLGSTGPDIATFPNLTITEVADRALASLSMRHGQETEFAKLASDLLGFELPEPGHAAVGPTYSAFWIGPDSWMIDASYATHERLACEVKATMRDSASVVEQTDGWCRFDITGTSSCDMFERLCNADIRAMRTQAATRCAIHHIGCYLWCHEPRAAFSVLGPRSSAGSLHHALVEAAQAISQP